MTHFVPKKSQKIALVTILSTALGVTNLDAESPGGDCPLNVVLGLDSRRPFDK